MIRPENVKKIGRLLKPHGYKGEIALLFDTSQFADINVAYYFFDIDGLLVPFFVEEMRFSNDTLARVKFEDVDDETKAARFANISVFLPKEQLGEATAENESSWHNFIGFKIFDSNKMPIGTISAIDEATINVLFVVETADEELLIPATEDFITQIDTKHKIIYMQLPEGLL